MASRSFGVFSLYWPTLLSLQIGSGSYENSHRKLTVECILSDPKIWSTCAVDLLVNISTPSGTVHLENGNDWFLKKTSFWYLQVAMYESTIPDHYIMGNGSFSIFFSFPKDTEWNVKSEIRISRFFNFWSQKRPKLPFLLAKSEKLWKFLSQTWNFIL